MGWGTAVRDTYREYVGAGGLLRIGGPGKLAVRRQDGRVSRTGIEGEIQGLIRYVAIRGGQMQGQGLARGDRLIGDEPTCGLRWN